MQLTCTLAIFACLFAADAAACNLSTGTVPFAVAAVPSAEAGDALRAPALEMVSLTRGINGRASCDASGLLTIAWSGRGARTTNCVSWASSSAW